MSEHAQTEREHAQATREAPAAVVTRPGSIDRHSSALERYLGVVAGERGPAHAVDHSLSDQFRWNLDNAIVADVMTSDVVSVPENASFKDIVDTLSRRRVSAVPVVDTAGKVLGLVSESDLLAKVVAGGDPRPRFRGTRSEKSQLRRKSHAEVASELMSSPAVTVERGTSVPNAARLAAFARVRRLPVVDSSGVLIGIVTRSDLLRVFLRDDEEIRRHIIDMFASQFCIDTTAVEITVSDGVVTLNGQVERRMLVSPLIDAVLKTTGVVGLHDNLTYRVDDTIIPAPRSPY